MVNRKWIYLLILFVIIVLRLCYMGVNEDNYYWDEMVYLHLSDNIKDGGYYSSIGEEFRAPLFPFLLSFFNQMHLIMFFLVIIGLVLIYYLGSEIYNEEVGLISAIILGAMELYFFYSFKLLAEPLTIIFLVGAMILLYKSKKNNHFIYLASVLMGLAVLTKYLAGVFAVSVFLYLMYKKRWKELIISCLIFILVLTPIFVLGVINYGNPLGMILDNFFMNTVESGGIFYYFLHFMEIFGWFIPLMFFFGLTSKKEKKPLLFFIVIYFIVLLLISTKYDRFLILLFPFVAIIASFGIYKFKRVGLIFLVIWVIFSIQGGLDLIEMDRGNTEFLISSAQELNLNGTVMSNSPVYFLHFSYMEIVDIPKELVDVDFDYLILDNYHLREDEGYNYYTNYIKEEGKMIYNFGEGSRSVIVYEKN